MGDGVDNSRRLSPEVARLLGVEPPNGEAADRELELWQFEYGGPQSPHAICHQGCHGIDATDRPYASRETHERLALAANAVSLVATGGALSAFTVPKTAVQTSRTASALRLAPQILNGLGTENGVELGAQIALDDEQTSGLRMLATAAEIASMVPTRRRVARSLIQELPEGSTVRATLRNGVVSKQVKEVIGRPGERYRLRPPDLDRLGREIELATKRLRSELGDIITPVKHDGGGALRQPFVERGGAEILESLHSMDALETADEAIGRARAHARSVLARRTHGAREVDGWLEYPDGWAVRIDPETSNFRFDGDGNIIAWFDPVVVRPPRSLKLAP